MSDSSRRTKRRRLVGTLALGARLGAALPSRFALSQSTPRAIRLAHHITTPSEQHTVAEI